MIKKENVLKFMQYIEKLAKVYEFNIPYGSYDIYAFAKDLLDWLERQGKKSSWKPSKEEMDALYSLSYITNEYDEHKEDVITHLYQDLKREFFNDSSYENMFSLDNKEDDVRRRSTIQILEYVRSLDAYNQYGKADIDKNIDWLEKQRDKDKLIQELGEYKIKYTQEVLEKYINSMSNKDDERLRKTAIAFLKDFAEQGYENAVECIDWLEKQGEQAPSQTNERAWLYLVSDVLTWKDGIGQYLDDPRVQEFAKKLCSEYAQKLYNSSVFSNPSNTGKNKQKFDPKTLKSFDRVLVRDEGNHWDCDLFSYISNRYIRHPYVTITCCYDFCIPYNDDTKHLVGTTEEAPEYYRYWED